MDHLLIGAGLKEWLLIRWLASPGGVSVLRQWELVVE